MDFGYKTFLALTLATASCWRLKAQNRDSEKTQDKIETLADKIPSINSDSIASFDKIQNNEPVPNIINTDINKATSKNNKQIDYIKSQNTELQAIIDSIKIADINKSLAEIEHDAVRFIAHFENIKMNAYWDEVAKKWTIGFGNTAHPDGKPVCRGDKIKDEAELMLYFREYFSKNITPNIVKYLPNWNEFSHDQKIVLCDLFWNAGSGHNVLSNSKTYNQNLQNLTEEQRQEIAEILQTKNQSVFINGKAYSLHDLPEWNNLSVEEKAILQPVYLNNNIAKGDTVNHSYSEKFQILNQEQRQEVAMMVASLIKSQNHKNLLYASTKFFEDQNVSVVNDSTVRYRGYIAEMEYHKKDIPSWYMLKDMQQKNVCKLLANANNNTKYNGRIFTSKDIPAIYFMNKEEQEILHNSPDLENVLIRKSTDNKNKPVLSNLGYELNLYALTKSQSAQERVATRLSSYIRSRGNIIPALQKRANIRAQVFLGKIQLNGDKDNSINLETVNIGAAYSLKISDLNDPQTICDSIKDCTYGKNFEDTMKTAIAPILHKQSKNSQNKKAQVRKQSLPRSGTRSR